MAVVDARGFNLNPNVGGNLAQGLNVLQGAQNIGIQSQAQQNQQQLRQLLGRGDIEGARRVDPQATLKFEREQAAAQLAGFKAQDAKTQTGLRNFSRVAAQAMTKQPEQIVPFLQRSIEDRLALDPNTDVTDTQELIQNIQANPEAGFQELQAVAKFGEQIGALQPLQGGQGTEIQKEVRADVRGKLKNISKQAEVIDTSFKKLEALGKEIKKGNRPAVAQAMTAMVKLGDPTSVVSQQEAVNALNQENPFAATVALLQGKGVKGDVIDSIMTKIDPRDPANINVDDLLTTGRALVSASVPGLQQGFAEAEEQAKANLTERGIGSLFTKGIRDRVAGLSTLLPQQKLQDLSDEDLDRMIKEAGGQ